VGDSEFGKGARVHATEEYSFDALARGLASGTLSRSQVLKLAGSTLLGFVLSGFALPATASGEATASAGGATATAIPSEGELDRGLARGTDDIAFAPPVLPGTENRNCRTEFRNIGGEAFECVVCDIYVRCPTSPDEPMSPGLCDSGADAEECVRCCISPLPPVD
jgi:hypothetical protein